MIHLLDRAFHWLWPRPEPALADAGRNGERIIARIRFWFIAALALVPLSALLRDPAERASWIGIVSATVLLGVAAFVLRLTRLEPVRWLGFATSTFDVSAVSSYHLLLFSAGDAVVALHSRTTFAFYLIAITATALRYDSRISVFAGGLAAVQWLALVAWADRTGLMAVAQQTGRFYGEGTVIGQMEEVVILLLATALAVTIVARTRVLRLSAIRDGLTGLHNRAYFDERVADELGRARRHKRTFALALVDIDHFKNVNDTFGHPVGDRVLHDIATYLRAGVRRTDLVARFGGEEFVIVLPEAEVSGAWARTEALRASIAASKFTVANGRTVSLTVSAGIALFPHDGDTVDRLIAVADERLLAAKQAGRNRVLATS